MSWGETVLVVFLHNSTRNAWNGDFAAGLTEKLMSADHYGNHPRGEALGSVQIPVDRGLLGLHLYAFDVSSVDASVPPC